MRVISLFGLLLWSLISLVNHAQGAYNYGVGVQTPNGGSQFFQPQPQTGYHGNQVHLPTYLQEEQQQMWLRQQQEQQMLQQQQQQNAFMQQQMTDANRHLLQNNVYPYYQNNAIDRASVYPGYRSNVNEQGMIATPAIQPMIGQVGIPAAPAIGGPYTTTGVTNFGEGGVKYHQYPQPKDSNPNYLNSILSTVENNLLKFLPNKALNRQYNGEYDDEYKYNKHHKGNKHHKLSKYRDEGYNDDYYDKDEHKHHKKNKHDD